MSLEYGFTVQKQAKGYRFVAPQYGLVDWASDLANGAKEFEARITTVAEQLREAGFDLGEINAEQQTKQPQVLLWPFFVKAGIIAVILAAVLLPVANAISRTLGPESPIGDAIRHPSELIIRMGEKVEQIPPQRMEEVKLAVRRLVTKLGPIFEELRPLAPPNPSAPPSPPAVH